MPSCTVMRRKLVEHSTLYLPSGLQALGRQEWVTEACGTPLFEDEHIAARKCRGCLAGWASPTNYPVQRVPVLCAHASVLASYEPGTYCNECGVRRVVPE